MRKILGIVNFESTYTNVEGLGDHRTISAVSILGRYRLCDFIISNLTNSNIQDIKILVKNKPRSLIEHISKTNYNINSKKGNINILCGEKSFTSEIYNTDIASMIANKKQFEDSNCDYVVIAPNNYVYMMDYNELIDKLEDNNADIVIMYQKVDNASDNFLLCDTLEMNIDHEVVAMKRNYGKYNTEYISLETYAMKKETLMKILDLSPQVSSLYSFSNIIKDIVKDFKIIGSKHRGYAKCINSLKAYYDCSMEMTQEANILNLYDPDWPIYTMTNDTCPTLYKEGGSSLGSVIGNGCIIEGEVINSVISRNVTIKKGAVVKNSVILPDVIVEENADIECAIVDRFAHITHINKIKGESNQPVYINKGDKV